MRDLEAFVETALDQMFEQAGGPGMRAKVSDVCPNCELGHHPSETCEHALYYYTDENLAETFPEEPGK